MFLLPPLLPPSSPSFDTYFGISRLSRTISTCHPQHVLIIGPGLGRSEHTQNCARAAFELAKETDIGVVVDADGLFLVAVSRASSQFRRIRAGCPTPVVLVGLTDGDVRDDRTIPRSSWIGRVLLESS